MFGVVTIAFRLYEPAQFKQLIVFVNGNPVTHSNTHTHTYTHYLSILKCITGFPNGSVVKNSPVMQVTQV